MTQKYLASLLTGLLLVLPGIVLANRPADQADEAAMEPTPTSETEMMGGRPADNSDNPYMHNTTQTSGDVLNMPAAESATGTSAEVVAEPVRQLDFPRRGMTEDKVQNELGRPAEIIPPIGQPPITRWVYDDRVVYFEYSSVIHVVAK